MGKNLSSSHNEGFKFIIDEKSILGDGWLSMYRTGGPVQFKKEHFERAMTNLIREPNINSTAILRADILSEVEYDLNGAEDDGEAKILESKMQKLEITEDLEANMIAIDDIKPRLAEFHGDNNLDLQTSFEFVRRIIPRNPSKDALINQTCLILNSPKKHPETSLIIYTPHIEEEDDYPFYIPRVKSVAILLHENVLSVHYLPFPNEVEILHDEAQRVVRTAYRLLQTASKHSKGVMQGYDCLLYTSRCV